MPIPCMADVIGGASALPQIRIVDVGANPLADVKPPYQVLLDECLASVFGFEPDPATFAKLQSDRASGRTYLPFAVGDGARHQFRICTMSGMNSLLPPNFDLLNLLHRHGLWAEVKAVVNIETKRLDDIVEVEAIDYLKIDIQGSELMVFENAEKKLKDCLVVHSEVMFVPMYEGQPLFSEQELFLRKLGLQVHKFFEMQGHVLKPFAVHGDVHAPLSQVFWADVVFIKDITRLDRLSPEQLLKLAIILHYVYDSLDVAHLAIEAFDRATHADLASEYRALILSPAKQAA